MCAETALDSMYLDNLDEFINDEGKIVTCKSLCLTLKVHVNVAKQMLYHYVTKKRNEDKGDDLCVTYVVSGVVAGENEQPDMQKVMLVREENLNTVKSTMKKVISVHIYSISKSQLKDLNVLYTSNIDEVKRNLMTINSYSGIECSSAKARSSADLAKLQQQNAYRDPEALPASEKKPIPEEKVPKGESKPEPKTNKNAKKPNNQIASMFARQSVKSEAQKDEKKEEKTTASKHPSAISKKSGGISAFFNKAPTSKQSQTPDSSKSSPVETESPTTKSPRKPESDAASSPSITESIKSSFKTESQDSDSKDFHLDAKEAESSQKKKAKTQSKLKPKKNSQKRGKTKHSDDESPIPKRKRIMQLSDSESSSEEENEEEEESPLPDPSLIESDEEVLPRSKTRSQRTALFPKWKSKEEKTDFKDLPGRRRILSHKEGVCVCHRFRRRDGSCEV
ncbi:DNA polymerase delta subunit 3-like [Macrobrachium rosenbergii]|uniref:DNA polymerase delta subunit 3-like n=1 Tax=Macrobrachium rosenbergii TaxID=79674 RepID=UPI0034D708E1